MNAFNYSGKQKVYLYWIMGYGILLFTIAAFFLWRYKGRVNKKNTSVEIHNIALMKNHRGKVFGIDVSQYQGNIHWEMVDLIYDEFPVDFIFIRATMGAEGKDRKFEHNWSEAFKQNKLRGAYHYFRPKEKGLQQANNFIKNVKLTSEDLPPVLDIEEHLKIMTAADWKNLKAELKIWLDIVEAHYGIRPIVYSPDTYFTHFLEKEFKNYVLWIANYNIKRRKSPKEHWNFWQFSEKGKVSGIVGAVDLNMFCGNISDLQKLRKKKE